MVKTEEKDYWNKEEIGERLKWLTVVICAMTIGMINLLVYYNPFTLLSEIVGILIGFLGVRFYKKIMGYKPNLQ